jgi:ABC-type transport system involved in cytochrome c biogenesis ATPase subunit
VKGFRNLRPSASRLHGRDRECAILDGLLSQVRKGRSGVLLLRGEPGIGKTALLRYLIEAGSGSTRLRSTGVESEMELPFARLSELQPSGSAG